MKIISVRNIDKFVEDARPKISKQKKKTVETIISKVQKNGDSAIRQYEKKFIGAKLGTLRVSPQELKSAFSSVTSRQINAIKEAKKRLEKTEFTVKNQFKKIQHNSNGVKVTKFFSPIDSVGCYIPGGLAKYPSSLIMSVVPAKVAGVNRIVAVSPPNKEGKIDPMILVAAKICGVDEFYKTGGVQAIAALSYGTKSITKVDKIVGPGGAFVTTGKFLVSENTAIDMLAGPTELGVIVDDSKNSDIVAADIISQAEHSTDTFCYVITSSLKIAKAIDQSISRKLKISKRNKIIKKSLSTNGFIAICKNQNDIIKLANQLAPEHLEIISKKSKIYSSKIKTAGLVLLGKYSPSAASDFLLGSNHILPTGGFGKSRGSLSVLDFMKLNTEIESSAKGLRNISKFLKEFSLAEDLPNHFEAVRSRF